MKTITKEDLKPDTTWVIRDFRQEQEVYNTATVKHVSEQNVTFKIGLLNDEHVVDVGGFLEAVNASMKR